MNRNKTEVKCTQSNTFTWARKPYVRDRQTRFLLKKHKYKEIITVQLLCGIANCFMLFDNFLNIAHYSYQFTLVTYIRRLQNFGISIYTMNGNFYTIFLCKVKNTWTWMFFLAIISNLIRVIYIWCNCESATKHS